MEKEMIGIRGESFEETIPQLLEKLKTNGCIKCSELMTAYDLCFKMTTSDNTQFMYDYFVKFLNDNAPPELSEERYLYVSDIIYKMSGYINRFWITEMGLIPLNEVALNAINKAKK